MSENKSRGRSRKKKVSLVSRFHDEMRKARRLIAATVCISVMGSSMMNPAMLAYADSEENEIQKFELEREAIGQAVMEAVADGSMVSVGDLSFSGSKEETYTELFGGDSWLYEVKPEVNETKDDDGSLDLRVFMSLDRMDLLDGDETLESYEITGNEEVFFLLVNKTDMSQNAVIMVDGRETDVITVAPENEVAGAAEGETISVSTTDDVDGNATGDAGMVAEEKETGIPDEETVDDGAEEADVSDDMASVESNMAEDRISDDENTADMSDSEVTDDIDEFGSVEDMDADVREHADNANAEDTDTVNDADIADDADTKDSPDDSGVVDGGSEPDDADKEHAGNDGGTVDSSDNRSDSSNDDSSDRDSDGSSENGDSSSDEDNDGSGDRVASISAHRYSLVTIAAPDAGTDEETASSADAKKEEHTETKENSQLEGELYDAVAMKGGAAVVFVTTAAQLGLESMVSEHSIDYTAETESAVITASVPEGAFDEEVSLSVEEMMESSETWQQVAEIWKAKNAQESVSEADSAFVVFDICFKNEADEEVEPGANIRIRIRFVDCSVLTGYDEISDNLSLLHISDDGEVEEVKASTMIDDADGVQAIEYEVSSFSLFTVRIMTIAADENNLSGIYLDGVHGSDENDGSSDSPVATFAKAKELLEEAGYDIIYVTGTVTVSSEETWSLGEGQSLKRQQMFTDGALVEVASGGTLTLENITVDGGNVEAGFSLIRVNGGDLILNDGTIVQNSRNTVSGAISEQEAAITVLDGTLVMNGGTVSDNSGNWGGAIAVVAKSGEAEMIMNGGIISGNNATTGGGILLYGNATFTMNGGSITENEARDYGGGIAVWSGSVAIVNAGDISDNIQTKSDSWGGGAIYVNAASGGTYTAGKLYLYNVEIAGNTSVSSSSLDAYRATIAVCQTGVLEINITDGSVIHDNDTCSGDLVLQASTGEGNFKLSPFMLSGGAYNWTQNGETVDVDDLIISRESYNKFETNPTEITGLDRVKTTINGNTGYGLGAAIGVNGELYIGHDDGEVTLEMEKKWGDAFADSELPDSVEVEIIATNSQGTETDLGSVTLNASDGWTKTITGLPKYDSFYDSDTQTSGVYTYTVAEKESDWYFTSVSYEEADDGDGSSDTVTNRITLVNIPKAELSVQKVVEGETTEQGFMFTITLSYQDEPYNGMATASNAAAGGEPFELEFTDGVATVSLDAGETITMLLGAGMVYCVNETDSKDASDVTYSVNGELTDLADGTLDIDGASIVITNIYKESGDLTVTKKVQGAGADISEEFAFTVILDDDSINGVYGDMTFVGGVAEFTLAHGESRTAEDLPAGVSYAVTETAVSNYQITPENETGVIERGIIKTVTFTNTYTSDGQEQEDTDPTPETGAGTLTVSKTVTGSGSKTKEFTFTVTLSDTSINGIYGDMTFVNGVASFTLKHGESKTAEGLPEGIEYTVTESDANGYRTTSDGATGVIERDGIATVTFTNRKTNSGGGGGGSSSGSSGTGTTSGSASGPGVLSGEAGTSDSDGTDTSDSDGSASQASPSDAESVTALPKMGDHTANSAMFTFLFGMAAIAYVILSDHKKENKK